MDSSGMCTTHFGGPTRCQYQGQCLPGGVPSRGCTFQVGRYTWSQVPSVGWVHMPGTPPEGTPPGRYTYLPGWVYLPGGVPSWGCTRHVYPPHRRDLGPGVPTPQKGPGTRHTHSPMDRMTDTCENITFLQLRWGR